MTDEETLEEAHRELLFEGRVRRLRDVLQDHLGPEGDKSYDRVQWFLDDAVELHNLYPSLTLLVPVAGLRAILNENDFGRLQARIEEVDGGTDLSQRPFARKRLAQMLGVSLQALLES